MIIQVESILIANRLKKIKLRFFLGTFCQKRQKTKDKRQKPSLARNKVIETH